MIDREEFEQAIERLSDQGDLNVSALAETLSVSRDWLYRNFPEVKNLSRRLSDDDVILEIEGMRAVRPTGRITIDEISKRLGITRQTFSRRFRHLYSYLSPDAAVFAQESVEEGLLQQVKELETKVRKLEDEQDATLANKESEIFSTLMRQDAEEFETIKVSSSLKRLQDQVEDKEQLAREKIKEIAELRLQISKLKSNEAQGGCEIINHLKPDYSAFRSAENASLKDLMKLFNEVEKRNFDQAEEIAVEQRPDYVILFQPFFSCDRSSMPALPVSGKVLLVESNMFRADIRNGFVKNLSGFSLIAIHAINSLAKTKMWARGAKVQLSDEFIVRMHENIMPPVLDDGFSAVISFDPEGFMK